MHLLWVSIDKIDEKFFILTILKFLGSILIRNWKALSLDTITPGPKMTVGEMLGELSALATLRIQVLRPKSSMQEIKDNLLSYLIKKNRNLLSNSSCPLDIVSKINCESCKESD